MKIIIKIFLIVICLNFIAAEELKKLSFEQVYQKKGEKILNDLPDIRKWADDKNYYLIKDEKLFLVAAKTGNETMLIDKDQFEILTKKGFAILKADGNTEDYHQFIFIKEGDLFLFLRKSNQLLRISKTKGREKNPTFSPDGLKIAYTLDGNLFVYLIPKKQTIQLTKDGSKVILNGYASWIYYEEILSRRSRYRAFWWNPDSTKIVFYRFDQSNVPLFPIYSSKGAYGKLEKMRYPKPGFPNPLVKLGIVDLKDCSLQWIPFNDEKDHYLIFPCWGKRGKKIYFQWLNRDQNFIKILRFALETKTISQVYQEKQATWVDFYEPGDLKILTNGDIILRSSKSGWFHLYYISNNRKIRQITSGDWSVKEIKLVNEQKKQIYFTANKQASTKTDFFRVNYSSRRLLNLTPEKGSHYIDISPKGSYFIDSYSAIDFPTRMVLKNNDGAILRKLGDRFSAHWKKYQLATRQLFTIKTTDGYNLPAAWYLPPKFDKNLKYPVIFSVYGGPGSSSVNNSFGRRSLGNYFLAQQGIIIFSVDHRGSGHFGKKGIDLMHRNLGKWEMFDYIEAVKYLRKLPFVDEKRIAITGGSYGGYVTALALTYGSNYFQYGIADASVIDWRLYDSVYTEKFMDTPQNNTDGYKSASVLTYIDKLKDNRLLITHGNMDDNVHMQNTIQFLNKAQNAHKLVKLMIFPGARHGVRHKEKRVTRQKLILNFWLKNFF